MTQTVINSTEERINSTYTISLQSLNNKVSLNSFKWNRQDRYTLPLESKSVPQIVHPTLFPYFQPNPRGQTPPSKHERVGEQPGQAYMPPSYLLTASPMAAPVTPEELPETQI